MKKQTVFLLMSGRFTYRLSITGASLALLAAWGPEEFGLYASTLGGWLFLNPLVSWGLEKAALSLLPRSSIARSYLLAIFLSLGGLFTVLLGAGLGSGYLLAGSGLTELSLSLGLLTIMQGLNQALVGFKRAFEQPCFDYLNYFGLSAATLCGVGLALSGKLNPLEYVLGLLGVTLVLNGLLLFSLKGQARFRRNGGSQRRLVVFALKTSFLMGFNNFVGSTSVSVLFFVLAWNHLPTESSYLLIAMSIFNVGFAFSEYLLRIYQPRLTVFLKNRNAQQIRKKLAVRLQFIILLAPFYLGLVLLILVQLGGLIQRWNLVLPGYWPSLSFLLSAIPLFLTTEIVNYILENLNAGSLVTSSLSNLGAFGATTGLSFLIIPAFGSPGAIGAWIVGEIVNCLVVFFFIYKRDRRKLEIHVT